MRRAIELAERGWGRVAPNPLVGAVVVREGRIVGEGWHTEYGKPHAEVEALAATEEGACGSTLYVTLEPCAHTGKTAPCTKAILAAGVRRVVFACDDPNPVARGGGEILQEAGVEVTRGVEEERARTLNGPFFHAHAERSAGRPWLELKVALSLDGRVADSTGRSVWITGDAARAEVHRLRAGYDAIAVGIGTVLEDDPILTVRGEVEPRTPATRIVFDRRARLPLQSRLVASAAEIPLWVVCSADADVEARGSLENAGVRVLTADTLEAALGALKDAGIGSVFCEGGARIATSLLRDELADRLTLFIAPLLLGPEAVDPFAGLSSPPLESVQRWKLVRSRVFDMDTMISVER